jgi:hypothetical protein
MAKKDQKVRVLIGTRKGGYIAESDTKRKKWKVSGPFQPGKDVFHLAADPRHPGDVYSAANSGFFGPMLFRSSNWGKTWTEIAPPMMTVSSKRPSPFDEEAQKAPKPIVNIWHVEPGPENEPNTVFLGIDPASMFRSDDRGESWVPVPGLNEHETRPKWNPGAGGMCLHTIVIDPTRPKRMYAGISAAGTFRSDDGGERWRPVNKGVQVSFLPEKAPEVGQCVHKVAIDAANPNLLYRQDHDGIYVSHDAMESWVRVGKPLPNDFGFVVATSRSLPGQAFFVPLEGEARITMKGGVQVYRWTDAKKKWTPMIRGSPWPGDLGTHREGLAADNLDPAGLYLGTTTGQLLYSSDAGKSWGAIPYYFPAIHSVSAAGPPGT